MPEEERGPSRVSEPSGEERLEAWLRPFLDDSLLWPVLAVAIGMVATNLAPLFVLAFRDRHLAAIAALGLLAALGARGAVVVLRRRRLGPVGGAVVAIAAIAALEAAAYLTLIER
jgi:hypothetical protein